MPPVANLANPIRTVISKGPRQCIAAPSGLSRGFRFRIAAAAVCRGGIWQTLFRSCGWNGATRYRKERGRHASARLHLCSDKGMRCAPYLCRPPQECVTKTRVLINTVKTAVAPLVGHGLARINVWAQIVARYAVKLFSTQNIFGGQLLRLIQPTPYRRLAYAQISAELRLRSSLLHCLVQRFVTGGFNVHIEASIGTAIDASSGKIGWRVIGSPIGRCP